MRTIFAIVFICIYSVVISQNITFTKVFETRKKSVPVAIINNHETYFHVLRYNKSAHDLTIERRKKPNGEIVAFTPLKLDSINAKWFDYENLDYLIFEDNYKLYFVFTQELITENNTYLKIIDTTGKSEGFFRLATGSTGSDNGVKTRVYQTKGNKILVRNTNYQLLNDYERNVLTLFDPKTKKQIWKKELPRENAETLGSFEINDSDDLYYINYRSNMFTPLYICKSEVNSKEVQKYPLSITNFGSVRSGVIIAEGNTVLFSGLVTEQKEKRLRYLFYTEKLKNDFSEIIYSKTFPLPDTIRQQLTFYDGTEQKEPEFKFYYKQNIFLNKNKLQFVSQRTSKDNYNELLCWNTNVQSGNLNNIEVVPRKTFYFASRTRFRNAGEAMSTFKKDSLSIFVSEHPGNFGMSGKNFNFNKYKKQNGTIGNLVRYKSGNKSLIYKGRDFDLVPMRYISENTSDDVFYFVSRKKEKFGLLPD
ncbi:MAG: hypothetical protein K0S32_3358 [Bacteroidetes bacterium]|jgi:hypothetical protein|nr:hypothetical protein [Bacteroidota bacterium]